MFNLGRVELVNFCAKSRKAATKYCFIAGYTVVATRVLVIKSWHEGSVFICREEQLSLVHGVGFYF